MKIILSIELCLVMRKRFMHLSKSLRFLGYRRVKELEYRDEDVTAGRKTQRVKRNPSQENIQQVDDDSTKAHS